MDFIFKILFIQPEVLKVYLKVLFGESPVHYAHAYLPIPVFIALLPYASSYAPSLLAIHVQTRGDTIRLRLIFLANLMKIWVIYVSTFLLALAIQEIFYLGSHMIYYRVHTLEVKHFELYFKKQKKQVLGPYEVAFVGFSTWIALLVLDAYVFKILPFVADMLVRRSDDIFNWLEIKVRAGIEKTTTCALTTFGPRNPFIRAVEVGVHICETATNNFAGLKGWVYIVIDRYWRRQEECDCRSRGSSQVRPKKRVGSRQQSAISVKSDRRYMGDCNHKICCQRSALYHLGDAHSKKSVGIANSPKEEVSAYTVAKMFEKRYLLPNVSSLSDVSSVSSYSLRSFANMCNKLNDESETSLDEYAETDSDFSDDMQAIRKYLRP